MANRCPSCNKFPAYQAEEPEVESLDVDADGVVSATVRIQVSSECCGEAMREATFENDVTIDIPDADEKSSPTKKAVEAVVGTHDDFSKPQPEPGDAPTEPDNEKHTHELEVEEDGVEQQDKYDGKGRGQKHLYGYKLDFTVKCADCDFQYTGSMEDFVQFSHMDESC